MQKNDFPNASVVIPHYRNERVLRKVLKGMLELDYPNEYEVIVVNDGCGKETEMLMKEFGGEHKIKTINLPRSGVCKARNAGIAKARFEIVINMDHDCIPYEDWLNVMVKPFGDEGVGVVTGYGGYGGTSTAFRAEVLKEVGGYDEDYFYYREDTDLAFKIIERGYKIVHVPKRYIHDHKMTKPKGIVKFAMFMLQRLRYHMNDVLLYKKHPNKLAKDFLNIKFGFLVSPKADFGAATGGWHKKAKFGLSSPRGITFIENKSPLHALVIVFVGVFYMIAVKFFRLMGSVKYGKFLI